MKSLRLYFACVSVSALAALGALASSLAACGGDDVMNSPLPLPDATTSNADTGATTTRPDSSTGNDANVGADAPPSGDDGGSDAQSTTDVNGGLPVTPGELQCGASICSAPSQQCCAQLDGGGSCAESDASCPLGTGTLKCLESADCAFGTVCCATLGLTGTTAQCSSNGSCVASPVPINFAVRTESARTTTARRRCAQVSSSRCAEASSSAANRPPGNRCP